MTSPSVTGCKANKPHTSSAIGYNRGTARYCSAKAPTCIATSAMHCDVAAPKPRHSPGPRSPAGLRGINLARAQSSLQEKVPFVNRRCFNHRTESARRGLYGNPNQPRAPLTSFTLQLQLPSPFNFNTTNTQSNGPATIQVGKENWPSTSTVAYELKLSEAAAPCV